MCMGQMCSSKTCLFSSMHWIIIDAWSVVVMLLAKFLLIHHCTVTFLEFHFFSSVNLPVCVSYLWLSLHLALVSRCCSSMPIFGAAMGLICLTSLCCWAMDLDGRGEQCNYARLPGTVTDIAPRSDDELVQWSNLGVFLMHIYMAPTLISWSFILTP